MKYRGHIACGIHKVDYSAWSESSQGMRRRSTTWLACIGLGDGVKQDFAAARAWFLKAAEQGLADAQFSLGGMHMPGDGVKQDSAQAVEWYRKAARQGEVVSQYNLGCLYEGGVGVKRNISKAVKWYSMAAALGYEDAKKRMRELGFGCLYRE